MPKGQPQVRAGLVGPNTVREEPSLDPLAKAAQNARDARPAAPQEVVFQARAKNYIFQITAPAPIFDPATGRVLEGRPRAAKFQASEYRTSDPETIAIMKADRAYGVGRDFWDVAEMQQRAAEANEAQLLRQLEADPELAKKLLQRLQPSVESFAAEASQP
jgi:hypothetical protein